MILLDGPLGKEHQDRLNVIAEEIRPSYIELFRALAGPRSTMDWWVSEIASRNTYTNTLFSDLCLAVLGKELLADGKAPGIDAGSVPIASTLRRYARSLGQALRVRSRSRWRLAIVFLRSTMGHFRSLAEIAVQWAVCRIFRSKTRALSGDITLVDTFVFEDSFSKGEFRDRYYADFGGHLTEGEWEGIHYMPTISCSFRHTVSVVKALRGSRRNFVLKEDFLNVWDYAYAFLYPLRALALLPRRTYWEGLDITPTLRWTWAKGLFSAGSVAGLLKYRLARRLAERGIRVRLVIDWFENQNIDKGANGGFRRYFPETPVVGYQGFIVPRYYLCMYPTSQEKEAGVLPTTTAVCGSALASSRKEFCRDLNVEIAPAFRFAGVWEERRTRPDPRYWTVLVSLPLEDPWRDVFALAVETTRKPLPCGTRFWVKVHPAAPTIERSLRRFGFHWPEGFEKVEGHFSSILDAADMVLSNSSSTCVESLARGVPVMVVAGRVGITQNPVPEEADPAIWRLCRTGKEAAEAITFFADRSSFNERERAGLRLREKYFEPVTPQAVRRFLRLP